MFTKEDLANLATLARLDITPDELTSYQEDISSILGFLDQLEGVEGVTDEALAVGQNVNRMRSDEDIHTAGQFTDSILKNAPETQSQQVKVPKILHDNSA